MTTLHTMLLTLTKHVLSHVSSREGELDVAEFRVVWDRSSHSPDALAAKEDTKNGKRTTK